MPSTKTQLQIRVDSSSKTLPFDLRDTNGFRSHKAAILRETLREVKQKKPKFYSSVETLIADSLR